MNALGKLEVMNALGKLEVMNALPNSYVNPLHISRRSTPNHGPQYLCYKLNYELLFISTFEFSYGWFFRCWSCDSDSKYMLVLYIPLVLILTVSLNPCGYKNVLKTNSLCLHTANVMYLCQCDLMVQPWTYSVIFLRLHFVTFARI